jgi:hypothetical protein
MQQHLAQAGASGTCQPGISFQVELRLCARLHENFGIADQIGQTEIAEARLPGAEKFSRAAQP